MIHESGMCKTPRCPRSAQFGMDGFCPRCFKLNMEKQKLKSSEMIEQLLLVVSKQVIDINERVTNLEGGEEIKERKEITEPKEKINDTSFIPSADNSNNKATVITSKTINKLSNMQTAVKKLKLIQPNLEV